MIAVGLEKIRGVFPVEAEGVIAGARAQADAVPDLEVQVGEVVSIRGADGADDLAAMNILVESHHKSVEVGVKGLEETSVAQPVLEHDHVAPSLGSGSGVNDDAVSDGVDGIAQIGVLAADPVPVVAEVIDFTEGPRVVGQCAVFAAEGAGKAVAERGPGELQGGRQDEAGVKDRGGGLGPFGMNESDADRAGELHGVCEPVEEVKKNQGSAEQQDDLGDHLGGMRDGRSGGRRKRRHASGAGKGVSMAQDVTLFN